jgi:hypothetical protein
MLARSWSRRIFRGALTAVLLACVSSSVWAQMRTLPATAKRATLTGYENPFVIVNGERKRLAPGAVIYDVHNRMILPGYLPDRADVAYATDPTGHVMRIYLLTPYEIQRLNEARR